MSETNTRMLLKTRELYDLTHTLARPWLEETVYPWEILDLIPTIIRTIGQGLDPRKYYNMMGKTDLFALMHLLKSAAAAVANDSGVMHLTAALGTPGVAVFGSTDHTSTGPISSSWKLVCTDQPCSPCFCRTCPKKDPKCMKRIEPQTVIRALGLLRIKGVPGEEK